MVIIKLVSPIRWSMGDTKLLLPFRHKLLDKKPAVGQRTLRRIALHYRVAGFYTVIKIANWLGLFACGDKKNNYRQSGQNY